MAPVKQIFLLGLLALASAAQQDIGEYEEINGPSLKSKIKELKKLLNNDAKPMITSITNAHQDLNSIIDEIKIKKETLENHRREVSETLKNLPQNCLPNDLINQAEMLNWNFDKCTNFTDDLVDVAKMSFNVTVVLAKVTLTFTGIVTDVVDCPSVNIFKAFRCFTRNVEAVRDLIVFLRDDGWPLVQQSISLGKKVRADFDTCVGIALLSKLELYQQINAIKTC